MRRYKTQLIMFGIACFTLVVLAVVASRNGCKVTRERGTDGSIHFEWNCSSVDAAAQ